MRVVKPCASTLSVRSDLVARPRLVTITLALMRLNLLDLLVARQDDLHAAEDHESAPYICPGCYAIGGEQCAGYCPDAAIERRREEDDLDAMYDSGEEDWT